MRVFAFALLCVTLARPAAADERPIGLRTAIEMAVRQNPTLAQAGADVDIADAAIETARGLDDFVLDASGNWRESHNELQTNQAPTGDDVIGSLAVTRPLPTGGRLVLRFSDEYLASGGDSAHAPSLQLALQHPLLRGVGVAVARAPRRRARAQRDVAGLVREATCSFVLRDVIAAYWDLAYATRELAIRRAAAASARDQLERTRANIDVGKQPPSASAEVEVAIALRDETALFAEENVKDRALELARLAGVMPTVESQSWVATDVPEPPGSVPEPGQALAAALEKNPQLLAVRAQGRAAAIEIDVTENGLLPQLDLSVGGGPAGNDSNAQKAFSQLAGADSYAIVAGLVFQQPIGRHAARGALAAAQAGVRKARLGERDLSAQVSAAVLRAVAAAQVARRRVEVLARSTDAAALDLAAERARFEVGRSTNFDVLRRQDELAVAQLSQARAKVDQLKAMAELETQTGELLGGLGVQLP